MLTLSPRVLMDRSWYLSKVQLPLSALYVRWMGYIELVGVEFVLLLAHVVLLQFVESLFLGLLVEELRVLAFVKGWPLLFEHVVDETIGGLLWISALLLAPSMVQQLQLSLKRIFHLQVLPVLFNKVIFLLFELFFLLALLDQIHKFVFELTVFPHFLVEEVFVEVVNALILLVLPRLFGPVAVLLFLVGLVFVKLLDFLLSFLPALLLLMLALVVERFNDVLSDGFSTFLLLYLRLQPDLKVITLAGFLFPFFGA